MKFRIFIIILFCNIQVALLAQENWVNQSMNTNKALRTIVVVDSNVVWAAGDSGIVIRTFDGNFVKCFNI